MENIEKILEKLMLNRTKLMLNRFDKQLMQIIDGDLQAFKSSHKQQSGNSRMSNMKISAA
jgi:hypothetical protein